MLRALLVLIGFALAALGGPEAPEVFVEQVSASEAQQADDHDCCPERPEQGEADDCCDTDLGKCCGTGLVFLAARAGLPLPPWAGQPAQRLTPPPLLLPRATGPPPTPPPIG